MFNGHLIFFWYLWSMIPVFLRYGFCRPGAAVIVLTHPGRLLESVMRRLTARLTSFTVNTQPAQH